MRVVCVNDCPVKGEDTFPVGLYLECLFEFLEKSVSQNFLVKNVIVN